MVEDVVPLSLAAGASVGVAVATGVVVLAGEGVAAWLSFAALGALTITVRLEVLVGPVGSVMDGGAQVPVGNTYWVAGSGMIPPTSLT